MSFFEQVRDKFGDKNIVLNVAHRGARSLAPENTLASAQAALKAKADLWEVDVRLTKDKIPVVIHDISIKEKSNAAVYFPHKKPWNLHDFTLKELNELDFGSWFIKQDPFGQIIENNVQNSNKFKGLKIVTFEQALVFTKENNWFINVELKDLSEFEDYKDFPIEIASQIKDMQMNHHALVSSFNLTYLSKIKKYQKNFTTGALINAYVKEPLALMKEIKADVLLPHWSLLDESLVKKLNHNGYKVLAWTVNDTDVMRSMISIGVNGIITDFPQILTTLLNKKNRTDL